MTEASIILEPAVVNALPECQWAYAITAHAAMPSAGNVMRYVPPHLVFLPDVVLDGLLIADRKPEGWKGVFIGLMRDLPSPHASNSSAPTVLAMSSPSRTEPHQLLVIEGRQIMLLTPRPDAALRMQDVLFPGQDTHTVAVCEPMSLHALRAGSVLWIHHARLRMALLLMPTAAYYPLLARNLFDMVQYLEGLWCALCTKTPALLEKAWAAKNAPMVPRPAIVAQDPYLQLAVLSASKLVSPFQMPPPACYLPSAPEPPAKKARALVDAVGAADAAGK